MENSEKKTVSRKVIDREVIMRKYHVHIKNFRNLKDMKVTLSPLTILTGENGSGKSTLFKALLFLKHNHDHEAAKKLKYVIDDDINLGGWEQIANDPKKPISIKITEETWGYDHEVEEIYDIDNCPFELNPTDEYAERLWENGNWIATDAEFESLKPISRGKLNVSKLRLHSNNREFVFQANRLALIKITTSNKRINFNLGYYIAPYKKNIKKLDELLFPYSKRLSYITIDNISSGIQQLGEILLDCTKLFFSYRMFSMQKGKEEDGQNRTLTENFTIATLEGRQLLEKSVFRKYLPLLIRTVLNNRTDLEYSSCLESLLEIFYEAENAFYPQLEDYLSLGTVRERPASRYFPEQIKPESYYGLFQYKQKFETFWELEDLVFNRYHNETFDRWLESFELGKSISVLETHDVVKLILRTDNDREVNLAESSSGALQSLPILFILCINQFNYRLFSIQQPELHLHPRLHSLLVDFFVEQISPNKRLGAPVYEKINSLEDAMNNVEKEIKLNGEKRLSFKKGQNLEYLTVPTHIIIETHSEHLLKKLQVLVSQGKTLQLWPEGYCSGEDVKLKDALSIYYFAKDKKGNTKAIEMELDDNGFFKTETPKGFFDESLELNRQLLLGRN
ncbi:hypothetical protein MASR1M107_09190 [Ignavibacteriales bacterium]